MSDRDDLIGSMLRGAAARAGVPTAVTGKDVDTMYGRGVVAPLGLQTVMYTNILPVNHIVVLRGPEASFKTTLGLELCRWFVEAGGMASFLFSEPPVIDIARGLLGSENYDSGKNCRFFPSIPSTGVAQEVIRDEVLMYKKLNLKIQEQNEEASEEDQMKAAPCAVLVDSLGALLSENELEKYEEEGFGTNRPAITARAWGTPLRAILSKYLPGSNTTLIIVNHEYSGVSAFSKPVQQYGGNALQYAKTVDFRLKRQNSGKVIQPDEDGEVTVRVQCKKNKLGPKDGEAENVRFFMPANRVDYRWHWDLPAARLLKSKIGNLPMGVGEEDDEGNQRILETIGPIEDLTMPTMGSFNCQSLELKKVGPETIMDVVRSHPETTRQYQDLIGIKRREIIGEMIHGQTS